MKLIIAFLIFISIFTACQTSNDKVILEDNPQSEWSVPEQYLKEGIPFQLMNKPLFKTVQEINSLNDNSRVALISFNNTVRVYPFHYTNKFEIVNDNFDNNYISISFCPITKSAICFNRKINNKIYNLIASGYLFKDNMVPADENLNFYVSQMLMKGIKGDIANQPLDYFNLIETKWKTVKDYFPNAQIFFHTNSKKNKSYRKNNIQESNLAYGIFNTKKTTEYVDLFFYNNFTNKTTSLKKIINQREVIIIGNKEKQIFTSFYIPKNKSLSLLDDINFPNIILDTKGNIYNIFGYAISGPDTGKQLESPKSYVANFWAWKDFFENLELNN